MLKLPISLDRFMVWSLTTFNTGNIYIREESWCPYYLLCTNMFALKTSRALLHLSLTVTLCGQTCTEVGVCVNWSWLTAGTTGIRASPGSGRWVPRWVSDQGPIICCNSPNSLRYALRSCKGKTANRCLWFTEMQLEISNEIILY